MSRFHISFVSIIWQTSYYVNLLFRPEASARGRKVSVDRLSTMVVGRDRMSNRVRVLLTSFTGIWH